MPLTGAHDQHLRGNSAVIYMDVLPRLKGASAFIYVAEFKIPKTAIYMSKCPQLQR